MGEELDPETRSKVVKEGITVNKSFEILLDLHNPVISNLLRSSS